MRSSALPFFNSRSSIGEAIYVIATYHAAEKSRVNAKFRNFAIYRSLTIAQHDHRIGATGSSSRKPAGNGRGQGKNRGHQEVHRRFDRRDVKEHAAKNSSSSDRRE